MKQQTLEKYEYSCEDIEKLIYEDICKRHGKVNKARVNIYFNIGSDPTDLNDYQGPPRQILTCANVSVDVTK